MQVYSCARPPPRHTPSPRLAPPHADKPPGIRTTSPVRRRLAGSWLPLLRRAGTSMCRVSDARRETGACMQQRLRRGLVRRTRNPTEARKAHVGWAGSHGMLPRSRICQDDALFFLSQRRHLTGHAGRPARERRSVSDGLPVPASMPLHAAGTGQARSIVRPSHQSGLPVRCKAACVCLPSASCCPPSGDPWPLARSHTHLLRYMPSFLLADCRYLRRLTYIRA